MSEGAEPTPRRRESDRLRPKDVVYLLGLVLVAASLWIAIKGDHRSERADRHATAALAQNRRLLGEIQQGRQVSLSVICAYGSAVGEAGQEVITQSSREAETPFSLFLEQHGYPGLTARRLQAKLAAQAYVRSIARHVNSELGQLGKKPIKGLLRKNGTIDCRTLQQISAVPRPR